MAAKRKQATAKPDSGDIKGFERTVRRMLDTPPKPHSEVAKKEGGRSHPKVGQHKKGLQR
jgi:hypothetical protein